MDRRLSAPGTTTAVTPTHPPATPGADQADAWTNRRVRRGSERPRSDHFRPLDRNAVARLLFAAEAYDRGTHATGAHGGELKRTGLAVLRAIANRFHNRASGRCDPSLAAVARAAGVARSTAAVALARLRAAGFLDWTRRGVTVSRRVRGVTMNLFAQVTNAYRLATKPPVARIPGAAACWPNSQSECRAETRFPKNNKELAGEQQEQPSVARSLDTALARLAAAMKAQEAAG